MFLWPARPLAKLFHIVIVIYKQEDKIGQNATEAFRAPLTPIEIATFVMPVRLYRAQQE